MTTFEVTIESAEAKPLRLLVEADNWVEAWQEGLIVMGDDPSPADASCVLDGGSVHVDVPSSQRSFVVRPVLERDLVGPRPRPGRPVLVTDGDASASIRIEARRPGAPAEARNARLARKPRPDSQTRMTAAVAPERAERVELPEPPTPISVAKPSFVRPPTQPAGQAAPRPPEPPRRPIDARPQPVNDPLARVLSDLERQRLLARPIRISSQTGLPQRIEPAARPATARRPTPLGIPRSGFVTAPDTLRKPEDGETQAFSSVPNHTELLPQQFRPVQATDDSDGVGPPPSRDGMLQWAVDTAWEHVPCELAIMLGELDGTSPIVVFARGEREREARGCRVPRELAFGQIACKAPTRVRFSLEASTGARIRFVPPDEQSFDLAIESALCCPVVDENGYAPGNGAGLGIVLINAARSGGFTDSELRALTYLARTLTGRLEAL